LRAKDEVYTLLYKINIFTRSGKASFIVVTKSMRKIQARQKDGQGQASHDYVGYSVAIMTHNEEASIGGIISREGAKMDKIIGKYRVRIEETRLILTHSAGISFDMTPDEMAGLAAFINIYQNALRTAQHDTEPRLKIVVNEESSATARD
jgi:hypothetical protein